MLMRKIPLKIYTAKSGHIVPDLRQKDFSLLPLSLDVLYNIELYT